MTLYRYMTTPQLAETGMAWHTHLNADRRIIYALAKRLEQEYERANQHRDKLTEVARDYVAQRTRAENLELELTMACTAPAGPGYIKVAKPHIQQVFTVPGNKGMWRCTGSFGTVQYGPGPGEAYAAWRRVMERGHGIPRQAAPAGAATQPARFRMNYMRRD